MENAFPRLSLKLSNRLIVRQLVLPSYDPRSGLANHIRSAHGRVPAVHPSFQTSDPSKTFSSLRHQLLLGKNCLYLGLLYLKHKSDGLSRFRLEIYHNRRKIKVKNRINRKKSDPKIEDSSRLPGGEEIRN